MEMHRNKQQQQPPQQQFRFNKVNTAPQNTNTDNNNLNDQNQKRKIDNLNQNNQINDNIATQEDANNKKLRQEVNENNFPNGNNFNEKRHLQILNDLTIYHKLKVRYDVISETGPQHAKTFQVKCVIFDPNTNEEIETYESIGSSINKAKQSAAETALSMTKLEKPTPEQMRKKRAVKKQSGQKENEQVKPMKNLQIVKNTSNDKVIFDEFTRYSIENQKFNKRHLLAKHAKIQPDKKHIELINFILKTIEHSLMAISDELLSEQLTNLANLDSTEEKEKHRELKAVFRTGNFAKGIFLKTDRIINLTVILNKHPHNFSVKKITEKLYEKLKLSTIQAPETYEPENLKANFDSINQIPIFCLDYKIDNIDYEFHLGFTCLELNAEIESFDDGNFYYPIEKCLELNNDLKKQNWYDSQLKSISNSLLILRILRDFCQNNPEWRVLSDDLVENLVHKCFFVKKFEEVSLKFREFFETISSGVLLLPELKLSCKYLSNSDADLFSLGDYENGIGLESREKLTYLAQEALRLITFNKIHILLGIDLISENNKGKFDQNLADNQNSSDSDGFQSILQNNSNPHSNESLQTTPPQIGLKPKPLMSLMSLNVEERKASFKSNNHNANKKPPFKTNLNFEKKKVFKKFGEQSGKKEIKPNSAAAAALAIANQSNKSNGMNGPVKPTPQPVGPPPVGYPNQFPPASSQSTHSIPTPVPPPNMSRPPPAPGAVPVPPGPPPIPGYSGYPSYPAAYDPYAYQAYMAQWQAQYYQQWQWAAMNQALAANSAKPPEPPSAIPKPPPPPPPPPPSK